MKPTAQRLVNWMQQDALPLWTTQALIPGVGASYETLYASGKPNLAANMRVRVQARQIFSFARAYQMGWLPHAQPLTRQLEAFIAHYGVTQCRSDGYVHLLSSQFQIVDAKRDLYDHAFYMLAYGALFAAFGDKSARRKARKIADWMNKEWRHPLGGWIEGDYPAPYRRQNPHMHLFETFLFLYNASQNDFWLNQAHQVYALFTRHFFNPQTAVVQEYFQDDWALAPGDAGQVVEPGHMFEWVWLLRQYQKTTGIDTSTYANALFAKGLSIGLTPEGLIYDAVTADGSPLHTSKRLWPLTELIKAGLAQAAVGDPAGEAIAQNAINTLFKYYLHGPCAGIYVDKLDGNNAVVDASAPASTLYHLMVASVEAKQFYQL